MNTAHYQRSGAMDYAENTDIHPHLVLFASLLITSGFFSLAGGVTIAIPAMLFAWVIGTSIVLLAEVGSGRGG